MRLPTRGRWPTLAPPTAESDAVLLSQFVAGRDERAFEALVHRHGPMVYAVCRRRLGCGADADDAFQAAFVVLARDAAKIADGHALPGWLYRVAFLTALKAATRTRPFAPLPPEGLPMTDPPDAGPLRQEVAAVVDAELATMTEKDRTVIVLCLIEGKTNVEAAARLGVPVGTVDSRLSTARKRLQAKLTRRGLAVAALLSLDRLLDAPLAAAGPALRDLIAATARGVLDVSAGALSPAVTTLAHGVSTMTPTKLKLLAAFGLTLGLLGGTGAGVYYATAQEKPAAKAPADPAKPAPPAKPAAEKIALAGGGQTSKTTLALDKPAGLTNALKDVTVADILEQLGLETGTTIRLDLAFFRLQAVEQPYEKKVSVPVVKGLSVRDILEEVLDQLVPPGALEGGPGPKTGIRVKGNQIILGRGSVAITTPGRTTAGGEVTQLVSESDLAAILHGPVVGIAAADLPLADFVHQLREQTGANIVVDARAKDKLQQPVTLTVNDTRLMTALKIAGDMADLAPAVVDNVYYLTTRENAARLLKETYRELYGEAQVPIPAGTVTDGVKLYEKPANLKEVDQSAPRNGLGGVGPGTTTVPESVVRPAEKK